MLNRRKLLLHAACIPLAMQPGFMPSAAAYDGPPVPDPADLITLVRETILAVDAGNKTGDYSSLAAMGGPAFKAAYPPEALAASFASLRDGALDLAAVRTMMPLTTRPPALDINGRLRILGYFEFPGKQVVYDVLYDYQPTPQRWLLAGISLKPRILPPQPELMQPQ